MSDALTITCDKSTWENKYAELKHYVHKFGDANVPRHYPQNVALGNWIVTQRRRYSQKKIKRERIQLLNEVGFEWSIRQKKWIRYYEELKMLYNQRVQVNQTPNPRLVIWIAAQRAEYKKLQNCEHSAITAERIKLLNDIGFKWTLKEAFWFARYEELKAFLEEDGDAEGPTSIQNLQLYGWVYHQRLYFKQYKNGKKAYITEEKIKLLNEISFQWVVKDKNASKWDDQYEKLKAYVKKYGHTRIPNPQYENSSHASLFFWINNQRAYYKKFKEGEKSILTRKYICLMSDIGFKWIVRGGLTDREWDDRYDLLKLYYEQFGHTRLSVWKNPQSLGFWARNQQTKFNNFLNGEKTVLTKRKFKLLSDIGFKLDPTHVILTWNDHYDELKSFFERFGSCRVPSKFHQNPLLGEWVQDQRKNYRKLLIGMAKEISTTQSNFDQLDKLGFEWCVSENSWEDRYDELVQYFDNFGDTRVPIKYESNILLGQWVVQQRNNFKLYQKGLKNVITEKQIALLNEIGFEWDSCKSDKTIEHNEDYHMVPFKQQQPDMGNLLLKRRNQERHLTIDDARYNSDADKHSTPKINRHVDDLTAFDIRLHKMRQSNLGKMLKGDASTRANVCTVFTSTMNSSPIKRKKNTIKFKPKPPKKRNRVTLNSPLTINGLNKQQTNLQENVFVVKSDQGEYFRDDKKLLRESCRLSKESRSPDTSTRIGSSLIAGEKNTSSLNFFGGIDATKKTETARETMKSTAAQKTHIDSEYCNDEDEHVEEGVECRLLKEQNRLLKQAAIRARASLEHEKIFLKKKAEKELELCKNRAKQRHKDLPENLLLDDRGLSKLHWKFTDPCSRLGLPNNCNNVGVIKRQYRKFALLYHPDKSEVCDAELKFHAVKEAYEILLERAGH